MIRGNYAFVLTGEEDAGPYHCFVLEAVPKRKDKYTVLYSEDLAHGQSYGSVRVVNPLNGLSSE